MKSLIALVLIIFCAQAWSSDEDTLFNIVRLHTEATTQVDNDQMSVLLSVEYKRMSPVSAAKLVNQDLHWALQYTKKHPAVSHQTYSYSTRPIYGEKEYREKADISKNIIAWRTTQQLKLVSEDLEQLTQLIEHLQTRFIVKYMRFSPSKKALLEAENALTEEALNSFKNRVNIIKSAMDERNYRILDLEIGNNHIQPISIASYHQARVKTQDSPANMAPVISAGKSEVRISVSGRVQLY